MAKQFVNIGIEGNDGTGDSIRDAFNKSNENFTELYAVFGQGGQIGFTTLSDTPDQLGANKIPVTNSAGTAIEMKGISGTGISVNFADPNNLILTVDSININTDTAPDLGGPINANTYAIGNVGISQTAVDDFNSTHGTSITEDDLVIDKGYADRRYLRSSGVGGVAGEVRIRTEPADATEYTKTISAYASGNLNIPTHGFTTTSNGLPLFTIQLEQMPTMSQADKTIILDMLMLTQFHCTHHQQKQPMTTIQQELKSQYQEVLEFKQ